MSCPYSEAMITWAAITLMTRRLTRKKPARTTAPLRLRSEASFAHRAGAAPLPTGSGLTSGRHRLNRGGNRQANHALWTIVLVRIRMDARTKEHVARRTAEGKTKKEIVRCLIGRVLIARSTASWSPNPAANPDLRRHRSVRHLQWLAASYSPMPVRALSRQAFPARQYRITVCRLRMRGDRAGGDALVAGGAGGDHARA
ncbi:hypothetical protein GCM10010411_75440 [Actinomadura fulvescens]|uniref:Transposase IS116/IS110/IS902 C-terminal domain-containing protein n=1 Tax=Actinomadura fulvescens TaxID=46160 RepID=A0ABN3QIC7_9ACTN